MTQGWTVGRKLALAFGVVIVLALCALAFSIQQIRLLQATTVLIKSDGLRKAKLAQAAQRFAHNEQTNLYTLFFMTARDGRVAQYKMIDDSKSALTAALESLKQLVSQPEERIILARALNGREMFQVEYNETVDVVELGNMPAAQVRMTQRTGPALDAFIQQLDELVALQSMRVDQQIRQSEDTANRAKNWILFLIGAAVAAAILSARAITSSITRPLKEAVNFAGTVAEGRLDAMVPQGAGGELYTLVQALEQMRSGIETRERHVTQLAFYDPLTQLPNRTLFNQRLAEASALDAAHFAVMALNLNRFKNVNDVLGYEAGDAVLQQVAHRIVGALPAHGALVARQQADEFSIYLPGVDSAGALAAAHKVLAAVSQPVELHGQAVDVDASIGLAIAPDHAQDSDRLITYADHAMHSAKRLNSGPVMYDVSHASGVKSNLSLLSELRHAVTHNELVLFYQPQLCLNTQQVNRAEALVRWRHPKRGLVPPDNFIPYAEQTGAIREVSRWVLQNACEQMAKWQEQDLHVELCINLSARDLSDVHLPDYISGLLQRHRIACKDLTLEVTESAAMEDPRQGLLALERLRQLGMRLSIDDFGTGYSSLSYLKKLPVEELKIDKSFVLHMDDDVDDHKIVRSTIDLGHIMDLEVIAEGVESDQSLTRLREYGCDFAQGYFIAKPMSADHFAPWLTAHRAATVSSAMRSTAIVAPPFCEPQPLGPVVVPPTDPNHR